jgi:hypothetical protein
MLVQLNILLIWLRKIYKGEAMGEIIPKVPILQIRRNIIIN